MSESDADRIFREVITVAPRTPDGTATPLEQSIRDFVYGTVWARPGLSRRDRRLVTLACVTAAGAPQPIQDHVYATLNSGDLTVAELEEFALHLAVYSGWPKARHVESVVKEQWARIRRERGEDVEP